MTVPEIKIWLKLDTDNTEEDVILQQMLDAIDEYFKNGIDNYDKTNESMMKILVIPTVAMMSDMYENRTLLTDSASGKTRYLVQSAILQANNCYPVTEVVE